MTYVIKLTSYTNCHSVVSSVSDFYTTVKLLVEDAVFNYKPSRRSNNWEFINLYFYEIKFIIAGSVFDFY